MVLLGGLVALLVPGVPGAAGAALLEPVAISAGAPESVEAGKAFQLEVAVEAEAGALDIAAMPLTLGVKLAPECGGSLAGTADPPVLQKTLPNPTAGAAYAQTVTGRVTATATGTDVVCAFLQDAQERQFATDTGAEVTVVAAGAGGDTAGRCSTVTRKVEAARRSLRRLDHRTAKVRRALHRAHGAHREALSRKLHKLTTHRKKAQKRRRASVGELGEACS